MKAGFLSFSTLLLALPLHAELQKVPGTLDLSFGGNGTGFNTVNVAGAGQIESIALDSQGRIIGGGQDGSTDVFVIGFTGNGILDTTFGSNGTGYTSVDVGGNDNMLSIALDSQGRIRGGGVGGATSEAFIIGFTPDGLLDTTFGGNGTGFNIILAANSFNSITIDSQDRILAAGISAVGGDLFIARFTPDGLLDTTFGGNGTGYNTIDIGGGFDSINSIALDPQGRIVGGGNGAGNALIIRFTSDGILDTTFGGNGTGYNTIDIGAIDNINSVVLDAQGKIVGGGQAGFNALIIRFTSDGILDTTFGGNGIGYNLVDTGVNDAIKSIALDPHSKIVAILESTPMFAFFIRFTSDGILDPTFGGNGTAFSRNFDPIAANLNQFFISPQGKLIAGGSSFIGEAFIMRLFGNSLVPLTTALREKYCGAITSN